MHRLHEARAARAAVKATLAVVAALVAVFGSAYGSIAWLDGRYAPLGVLDNLQWSQMKEDIRRLQDRIEVAQNPKLKHQLELDLQELMDRFCKAYPNDRACK